MTAAKKLLAASFWLLIRLVELTGVQTSGCTRFCRDGGETVTVRYAMTTELYATQSPLVTTNFRRTIQIWPSSSAFLFFLNSGIEMMVPGNHGLCDKLMQWVD